MSLVLYPDSEPDDHDKPVPRTLPTETQRAAKRRRSDADPPPRPSLPPLPAAFHDLYSTNARLSTSDDPSLHGGRRRAVPHVEGNWPSHVYLEWVPTQGESQALYRMIEQVQAAMHHANKSRRNPLPIPAITPSLRSELGAALPLHVSLSRTLHIKTDDRDAFLDALTSSLGKAAVCSFSTQFSSLRWVPNFERNRWFLVLGIVKPERNELNLLLDACNDAAKKRGHQGLYVVDEGDGPMSGQTSTSVSGSGKRMKITSQGACDGYDKAVPVDRTGNFHVSIAWALIEPDPLWRSLALSIDITDFPGLSMTSFEMVKARIGNAIHNISLGKKRANLG